MMPQYSLEAPRPEILISKTTLTTSESLKEPSKKSKDPSNSSLTDSKLSLKAKLKPKLLPEPSTFSISLSVMMKPISPEPSDSRSSSFLGKTDVKLLTFKKLPKEKLTPASEVLDLTNSMLNPTHLINLFSPQLTLKSPNKKCN